jgi:predicted lipid carrier protein YhbT
MVENIMKTSATAPQLPRLFSMPLRLLPARLHSRIAAGILQRIFSEQRTEGELDFMEGRRARIRVLDAGVELNITAGPDGFRSLSPGGKADLSIEGSAYDYLLLITGREDPDTLFFQRRLRMSGDTALGVHLKNFLASVDPDSLPLAQFVRPGLEQGLNLYERVLG